MPQRKRYVDFSVAEAQAVASAINAGFVPVRATSIGSRCDVEETWEDAQLTGNTLGWTTQRVKVLAYGQPEQGEPDRSTLARVNCADLLAPTADELPDPIERAAETARVTGNRAAVAAQTLALIDAAKPSVLPSAPTRITK